MIQSRDELVDDLWLQLVAANGLQMVNSAPNDTYIENQVKKLRSTAEWLADAMLEVQNETMVRGDSDSQR